MFQHAKENLYSNKVLMLVDNVSQIILALPKTFVFTVYSTETSTTKITATEWQS